MKKKGLLIIVFSVLIILSCKKNTTLLSSENKLLKFSVNGQLGTTELDESLKSVNIVVPHGTNKKALLCNFTVSKDAVFTLNGVTQNGNSTTMDFSSPQKINVIAPNGDIAVWNITVQTDLESYGLGSSLTLEKSINKTYNWYYDQGVTGKFSSINCGPSVATMAVKWSDPSFNKVPEDARNTYRSTGGWWYTTDIVNYLAKYGVSSEYTALPDNHQTIKKYLDKNYILILCLDNYYIRYNGNVKQRVDKYYKVNSTESGHFIIVKGYKQVDNKFYFEVYDPWSYGQSYSDKKLKGEHRYYISDDLETATNIWWDYAIIVAPKGENVVLSTNNTDSNSKLRTFIPAQKGG